MDGNVYTGVVTSLKLDAKQLASELSLPDDEALHTEFGDLCDRAVERARPKWMFMLASVEPDLTNPDTVLVAGEPFRSAALAANTAGLKRAFPYVATCGTELCNPDIVPNDMLAQYWLEAIKERALRSAIRAMKRTLQKTFGVDAFASMNPGSADAHVWPIEQQRELFRALGDVHRHTGIQLTESCLMEPNKSVSGVYFETETGYVNCSLCSRENCPDRRAVYDPVMTGS